jgi:uncharacterized protein YjhX (UPF0386 family)
VPRALLLSSIAREGSWGFFSLFLSFYPIWMRQEQRYLIACAAALSSEKEKGNIATIYCYARDFRGCLDNKSHVFLALKTNPINGTTHVVDHNMYQQHWRWVNHNK